MIHTYLTCLQLNNFRNFTDRVIDIDHRPVIIHGANGVGKTNILEAVSLMSSGRGIRNSRFSEMINYHTDDNKWTIFCNLVKNSDSHSIGVSIDETEGEFGNKEYKKICKVNHKPLGQINHLLQYLTILWITPQMDTHVLSSVSSRRNFYDKIVSFFDANHAKHITEYDNLLRQRLMLLLQNASKNKDWVTSIEQELSHKVVAIAESRCKVIEDLQSFINIMETPFPKAQLYLEGWCESNINNMKALELEEYIQKRFFAERENDIRSETSNFGTHKTNLSMIHMPSNMPLQYCSTGEQKSMLITIMMAVTRMLIDKKSIYPILLLDELASHLDNNRRKFLVDEIINLKVQAWLTCTDNEFFKDFGENGQYIAL